MARRRYGPRLLPTLPQRTRWHGNAAFPWSEKLPERGRRSIQKAANEKAANEPAGERERQQAGTDRAP